MSYTIDQAIEKYGRAFMNELFDMKTIYGDRYNEAWRDFAHKYGVVKKSTKIIYVIDYSKYDKIGRINIVFKNGRNKDVLRIIDSSEAVDKFWRDEHETSQNHE